MGLVKTVIDCSVPMNHLEHRKEVKADPTPPVPERPKSKFELMEERLAMLEAKLK